MRMPRTARMRRWMVVRGGMRQTERGTTTTSMRRRRQRRLMC